MFHKKAHRRTLSKGHWFYAMHACISYFIFPPHTEMIHWWFGLSFTVRTGICFESLALTATRANMKARLYSTQMTNAYQVHKVSNILFCSGKKIQNDFNRVIEGHIFLTFIKGFVATYLGYLDILLFSPFFHFIRIEFVLILKIYLYFCTKCERAFKFPMISFLSKRLLYSIKLFWSSTLRRRVRI